MDRIVLPEFGPVTSYDAAHIVVEDDCGSLHIVAYVPEPQERREGWDREDEFVDAVIQRATSYVASLESPYPMQAWVQIDPGRDGIREYELSLR